MLKFGNVLGKFGRGHAYVGLWGAAGLRYLCLQAREGRKHKQRENKGTLAHVAVDQGSSPGGSRKVASNIHPADLERNRWPPPRPHGAIDVLNRALQAQTVSGVFPLPMVV